MKNILLQDVAVVSVDNTKTFEDETYKELYVQEGEQAAVATKSVMDLLKPYGAVLVNVLEQHPKGHISFADNYLDKAPFQMITYDEVKDWTEENNKIAPQAEFTLKELQIFLKEVNAQMLWPQHAKNWTDSGNLMEPLQEQDFDLKVVKGDNPAKEAYSGFDGTNLDQLLQERNIKKLIIGGVATDYCVGNTALDAANKGYEVVVVKDAVRGVAPDTTDQMLQRFTAKGIKYLTVGELKDLFFTP